MLKKRATLTAILLLFSAVAVTLAAQGPGAAASDPALGGYCPVAYVAMNKAVKGDPAQSSVYEGHTYLFANADAKKMFDAAPEKYVPAYDGWCATAVAMGKKVAADPTLFTVHENKAYLFSNAGAKTMFDKDKTGTIAQADANWPQLHK